jgi:hypothetical protein
VKRRLQVVTVLPFAQPDVPRAYCFIVQVLSHQGDHETGDSRKSCRKLNDILLDTCGNVSVLGYSRHP